MLRNKGGQSDSWHIDLKDTGEVAKGEAPIGRKADGMFGLLCRLLALQEKYIAFGGQRRGWDAFGIQANGNNVLSHLNIGRRRLRQASQRRKEGSTVIHVGQTKNQGGCHESNSHGAYLEKSANKGKTLKLCRLCNLSQGVVNQYTIKNSNDHIIDVCD